MLFSLRVRNSSVARFYIRKNLRVSYKVIRDTKLYKSRVSVESNIKLKQERNKLLKQTGERKKKKVSPFHEVPTSP